jgi:hypothetical protein
MRWVGSTGLALALAAAFLTTSPAADGPKGPKAKPGHRLVGTWRLVSGKYGGRDFHFPAGTTMLKHVTPAQFLWATYDKGGKVFRAAGGAYTLRGDKYEETPEYGLGPDFALIKGKVQSFTARVEGKRWHHDGKLSNGLTIAEVWERLEPK